MAEWTPERIAAAEKAAVDRLHAVQEGKEEIKKPGILQQLLKGVGVGDLAGAVAGTGAAIIKKAGGEDIDAAKEIADGVQTGKNAARVGMDSFSGGLANQGRRVLNGSDLDAELAASEMAEHQLGPTGTMLAKGAGGIAQAAIPGAGAMSTVPKAMATGAALGGGNVVTNALGEGKLPDPTDVAMGTGMGAVGAGLGKVVGDRLGRIVERYVGKDGGAKMWEQAGKQVEKTQQSVRDASNDMINAGVRVKSSYIKRGVDALEKRLSSGRLTYRIGQLPNAKNAVDTLRKVVEDGSNPTLPEINEVRKVIRDSILDKNGAWLDSVTPVDARLVQQIDRQIASMIKGLDANPNAVASGNAKAGVAAFNKVNATVPIQSKANLIAGAFDRADLNSAGTGVPFDKALQTEFKKIYLSKQGKAEFRGPGEIALIREGAEGNFGTKWLNSLDRAYGHGGLFSFVWNSVNKVPRAMSGRAAESNARGMFEKITKIPLERAGAKGSVIGAQTGVAGMGLLQPQIDVNSPLSDLMPKQ